MSVLSTYKYHRATGAAAIASTLAPDQNIVLIGLKLHLDAGGAATDFTATIDSGTAAAYDVVLYTKAMNALTDVVEVFDEPIPIERGDEIDFAYANGGAATYGLEVIYRLEM